MSTRARSLRAARASLDAGRSRRVDLAAARWRAAEDAAAWERRTLQTIVCELAADGVSEYKLAEWSGVSRGTIRTWLGK